MRNARMTGTAGVGDQIQARGLHGRPSRRGKVVELLGSAGHEHYRVRWDDQHESIVYPSDGVTITARATGRGSLAEQSDYLTARVGRGSVAYHQWRARLGLAAAPLGMGDKPGLVCRPGQRGVGLIAAGAARCGMSFTERLCGSLVFACGLKARCAIVRGLM